MILPRLLWLFVSVVAASMSALGCLPIDVALRPSAVIPLLSAALVTTGEGPWFTLSAVEYASGDVVDVVPYFVVERIVADPEARSSVFSTSGHRLFSLSAYPDNAVALISAGLKVDAESISYQNATAVLFLAQGTLYRAATGGRTAIGRLTDQVAIQSFQNAGSNIVYHNASGLFRVGDSAEQLTAGPVVSFAVGVLAAAWVSPDFVIEVAPGGVVGQGSHLFGWTADGQSLVYASESKLLSWSIENNRTLLMGENILFDSVQIRGQWAAWLHMNGTLWSMYLSGDESSLGQQVSEERVTGGWYLQNDGFLAWVSNNQLFSSIANGTATAMLEAEDAEELLGPPLLYRSTMGGIYAARVGLVSGVGTLAVAQPLVESNAFVWSSNSSESNPMSAVACLKPLTVVGDDELLHSGVVEGNLILNSTTATLAGPVKVLGTAFLGYAAAAMVDCNVGQVILEAVVLFESFGSAVCGARQCPATVAQNGTHVWLVAEDAQCANGGFSWTVFGIVVGITLFLVVAVLILLYVWHGRQVERAQLKLQAKEDKYRSQVAMEPLMMSADVD